MMNKQEYRSLNDPQMRPYFNTPQMRRHLVKTGLIDHSGMPLSESEHKRVVLRRQQQNEAAGMLRSSLESATEQYKRAKLLELTRQMDTIDRIQNYRNRKLESLAQFDPLDSPEAPTSLLPLHLKKATEVQPVLDGRKFEGTRMNGMREGPLPSTSYGVPGVDHALDRYLHKMDSLSLQVYRAHVMRQIGELDKIQRSIKPRSFQDGPFKTRSVRLPALASYLPSKSASRATSEPPLLVAERTKAACAERERDSRIAYRTQEAAGIVPDSTWRPQIDQLKLIPLSVDYATPHQPLNAATCFIRYLGQHLTQRSASLSIVQQHTGRSTMRVYQGMVAPGDTIQFVSQRQPNLPLGLLFQIDSILAHRSNTCCEARYNVGQRLDGGTGRLQWLGVMNATPCERCLLYRNLPVPFSNYRLDRGERSPRHDSPMKVHKKLAPIERHQEDTTTITNEISTDPPQEVEAVVEVTEKITVVENEDEMCQNIILDDVDDNQDDETLSLSEGGRDSDEDLVVEPGSEHTPVPQPVPVVYNPHPGLSPTRAKTTGRSSTGGSEDRNSMSDASSLQIDDGVVEAGIKPVSRHTTSHQDDDTGVDFDSRAATASNSAADLPVKI